MKKFLFKPQVLALVLFTALFVSCSSEDGEDGATGAQGIAGVDGADGADGASV